MSKNFEEFHRANLSANVTYSELEKLCYERGKLLSEARNHISILEKKVENLKKYDDPFGRYEITHTHCCGGCHQWIDREGKGHAIGCPIVEKRKNNEA